VLVAIALAGVAAVLLLPEVASSLPRGDDPEPNAAQLAVTASVLVALTAAYLYVASQSAGLGTTWLALAVTYNAVIVVVKFILSPASFLRNEQAELAEYLWVGVAVMVLYVAALVAVFLMARRYRAAGGWPWTAKAGLVVALLVFAMGSRYLAAIVLGEAASDYLDHVFSGSGVWLPAFIAGASVAAIAAFDRAENLPAALGTGVALIVVYHGLWVPFMLRLF
jgi:hypothetical protein